MNQTKPTLTDRHVQKTKRLARNFALKHGLRPSTAVEIESECLLAIVEAAHSYDPSRGMKFWGWLRQNARWAAFNYLRDNVGNPEPGDEEDTDPDDIFESLVEESFDPLEQIIQNETAEVIADLLNGLLERERLVVKGLFGFDGDRKSQAELADDLGITQQMVSKTYLRAVRKMISRGLDSLI